MIGETDHDYLREPRFFFFTKGLRESLTPMNQPIQCTPVGKLTRSPSVSVYVEETLYFYLHKKVYTWLYEKFVPFTGASRYHNCCVDGGTSPEYFLYTLGCIQVDYVKLITQHFFISLSTLLTFR
jgi:hypothetical protein